MMGRHDGIIDNRPVIIVELDSEIEKVEAQIIIHNNRLKHLQLQRNELLKRYATSK